MKEIKKARMGIIAVLALMLVSITRRLPEARRLSSGITTLTLAGIVLLVAAGSVSAEFACVADDGLGDAYFFGDTVIKSCTLNGSMSGSGSGLFIGADGITIDGNNFGITGSNAAWSYGILNYNAGLYRGYHDVVIKNLDISGFQEGICIQGTSTGPNTARVENNTIYNCTVHDNGANTAELSSGCGIHFYYNIWNSTIDNCRVYNTTATLQSSCDSPGAGIRLYSKSCYNNVTNCEIYRNALAGIYSKAGSRHNRIDNNDVYKNAAPGADISFPGGIRMQCKNTNWWTVSNNEVWDNYGPGIFVGGQNCTVYKNEVTGSKNCTSVGDGSRGDGIIIDRSDTPVGGTYNNLTNNTVCSNGGYDIYMQAGKVGNHGDENTCDKPSNWNDDGTTGCTWICTGPSEPTAPDLIVANKSESWVTETTYNVNYRVQNIGNGTSNESVACISIDAAHQVGFNETIGELAPGAYSTVKTVGPFSMSDLSDTIKVCADCDANNTEWNESNNCLENVLDANQPDLDIIEKHEEWVDQAVGTYNIIYTVKNIGTAAAPISTTTVRIDGSMAPPPDSVPALAIGAKHTGTIGPRTMSDDSDTIILYADKGHNPPGDIDELDETNNEMENTFYKNSLKIYVDPPSLNITPQDQFDINIKVDPAGVEVYGVEYYLTYNTSVLRAESQVKGPFLGTSSETIVVVNEIDRGAGIVSYAETRKVSGGVTTEGISSLIQFTAIGAAGECTDLDLDGVIIVDTAGGQMSAIIVDGEVCLIYNQPPVAAGCTKHLHNNAQKKFECLAQLCSSSTDPDDDDIVYIRWSFGDGEYGTSEGLGVCPCKYHSYTSWIWEPFGDPNGDYVPFNASLTVTDNGDPQLEDTTYIDVHVYLAGDANADGTVNILDAVLIGLTWDNECTGTACCELLWTGNEMADKADLNNDCKINILDAVIVGTMWDHNAYYPV